MQWYVRRIAFLSVSIDIVIEVMTMRRAQRGKESTTTITVRLDSYVKEQAKEVFSKLGVDMTVAIDMFLRESIRSKGFPFDVNLEMPNETTLRAMEMAEKGEDVYGPFNSVEELIEALNADD